MTDIGSSREKDEMMVRNKMERRVPTRNEKYWIVSGRLDVDPYTGRH